ncbi:MAG: trigger factor [Syntrophomonadaceae bacterium]|nr:trigger factor [Syntrophomonadaceae bacterium]
MQAKLEKVENSEAYIQIEVDSATMEEGFEVAYRKIVKMVNIPGFRKGRAPRQLIENVYGKEVLYQDALEHIVPNALEEALETLNIEPIAPPDFDIGEIEDDKPFVFMAIVPVKPEITLGEIEGLEVTIPLYEVTEDNIEARIMQIRENYAELKNKEEEPAELGDIVTIDFEGFIDGVAFPGGNGEDYPLELGSNSFIPGFEEQLVGAKLGDVIDVEVTFPDEYHEDSLKGQAAVFKVELKEIETKVLRELDDEFVQEVSEFDTVAEFREDIKAELEEFLTKQKKEFLKNVVLDEALKVCEVPVPDAVVRGQAEAMLQDFGQRIMMQGLDLEQYFAVTNTSEEDFIQEVWPDATRSVKTNFMLDKIVEEKGFVISDEELDIQLEEMAASMGLDLGETKTRFASALEDIRYGLTVDKAVDYLVDNAKVTYTDPVAEIVEEAQDIKVETEE